MARLGCLSVCLSRRLILNVTHQGGSTRRGQRHFRPSITGTDILVFLPRDAYASHIPGAMYAMVRRVSVRHKSVFYRNG